MVASRVHCHVGSLWHMAFHTGCPFTTRFVMMVCGSIVFFLRMLMTGSTEPIVIIFNSNAMGIMTVRTFDAFVVHLALNERTKDIHFIHDLSIFVIGFWPQRFASKMIMKTVSARKIWMNNSTSGMTGSTGLNLAFHRFGIFAFQFREAIPMFTVPEE